MAKTPPNQVAPGPTGRRQLISQAQVPSTANVCYACAWRKTSNNGLKELRAANPELPASYSGILAGDYRNQIIIAQYKDNRQVGFIAIPIQLFEGCENDIRVVYERAVEKLAIELEANLAAQNEDTEDTADAGDTEDADVYDDTPDGDTTNVEEEEDDDE